MQKIKIAITGGIGCGKTTVLNCLTEMGYAVFSCDEIYKDVIQSQEYRQRIEDIFPEAINHKGVDRKILSSIVFNNEEKRKKLNEIAHPLIMNALLEQMENCADAIVFAEVPLLFEGNFEGLFDKILYLYREKASRIEAVCNRDGLTPNDVQKRINAQFNPDGIEGKNRLENCRAHILENTGTKEELKIKIQQFLANI